MSDVTHYIALPLAFSDDGVAAGDAAECLSASAAVRRNWAAETLTATLRGWSHEAACLHASISTQSSVCAIEPLRSAIGIGIRQQETASCASLGNAATPMQRS
ncbi:hypothetical protein [Bradyrhizobium diazoefficiens]|uniref:hypothetical protein n=1 Tax=Bradyrhizobium diazoefficiens TaxID=1355477 RepID=UPI001FEE135A|nr:hypothetical protein [Bradyrhizobium diazoefficiens]